MYYCCTRYTTGTYEVIGGGWCGFSQLFIVKLQSLVTGQAPLTGVEADSAYSNCSAYTLVWRVLAGYPTGGLVARICHIRSNSVGVWQSLQQSLITRDTCYA